MLSYKNIAIIKTPLHSLLTDKGLEDEMGRSPSSRSLLDLMTRENKALHQQVADLERQTHQLRAASTRVPPSECKKNLW